MDSITLLIILAMIMWLLQAVLGWLQIKAFNQAFMEISKKGKVTVGRNSGRFNPKSVIVLAFDDEKKVVDSLCMKGFSVFARPQKLASVIGLSLDQIVPEKIFPTDKRSQFALKVAISSGYSCSDQK
ncbi:DNA-binding transcriptional activator GutM [Mannheimia haemolytica]|uniref:DNA-binding transcriptional activator GutM n=1 Tax=Mannheimia haemolytica TaxID=75985 RepID=A0A448T714_MANHA|nr:transcriptional regulator GutM [Mannheimia haemolytica]VEI75777.1 DNA-binding transcriptional activator GutM [Mannheimia haemolytica]HDV7283466.1 transcriptional regulator GutM [Mannheimia haemolytica]